jgi:uncharacterized protein
MKADPIASDREEKSSQICTRCGFCCDGTLFNRLNADQGEDLADLVQIGMPPKNTRTEGVLAFDLPCSHFNGLCSVYTHRPVACRRFRCRLLRKLDRGEITVPAAEQVIFEAIRMRRTVADTLATLTVELLPPAKRSLSIAARISSILVVLVGGEEGTAPGKYRHSLPALFALFRSLSTHFLPDHSSRTSNTAVQTAGRLRLND